MAGSQSAFAARIAAAACGGGSCPAAAAAGGMARLLSHTAVSSRRRRARSAPWLRYLAVIAGVVFHDVSVPDGRHPDDTYPDRLVGGAKKTPRICAAFFDLRDPPYLETDRLNIRSIFSLVASQHDWLA
jgi:hypothetical protein